MAAEKGENKMDMNAMMEAYAKLGTPGAQHRILQRMAGTWDAKTKAWMEPGKAPVESSGSNIGTMIFGGRFLQEEFSGDMMGTPFSGLSITGYDNHSNKFESIWLDSTSTSILVFRGTASDDTRTLTMECSHEDALRGPMKWRSVTKFTGDNTHLLEMYSTDPNGKEEKSMEITYTRRS